MRPFHLHHLPWPPRRNNPSPIASPFRPQIDHPVRRRDDVQVVFDHRHGVAAVQRGLEHRQQFFHVGVAEAVSGFVEDVKGTDLPSQVIAYLT